MKRAIAAIALAGALTACGSATDHVTFAPPPAYKSAVSMGPFGQMWSGPNDNMMMLMALPTQLDLNKSAANSPVKNATIENETKIKICGDQPALFVNMVGNSETGSDNAKKQKPQLIEFLATNAGGKTYMVMYIRPKGTPADTSAEADLHNVCPK
jgi:hypothetical protein